MKLQRIEYYLKTLLLLMVFAISATASAAPSAQKWHDEPVDKQKSSFVEHGNKPQAILSNANELARICSSRPERSITSTSNFIQTLRTPVRVQDLFNLQKTFFCHYRGVGQTTSRPIMPAPSATYYVLTLRHLLC